MQIPTFKAADVDLIEKQQSYDGYFRIETYRLRHRLYEGGWGPEISREIFERGHAVALLPYDPVLDQVVLIEQFRCGAFAALESDWFSDDDSPWLLEAVAGIVETGETADDVARREAVEETGCPVTELKSVCRYLVSPGGTSESVFVFVGRTDASKVDGVHGLAHEGEDIKPFAVPFDDAFSAVENGRIINAMTIIALQWLKLNKAELRKEWSSLSPSAK